MFMMCRNKSRYTETHFAILEEFQEHTVHDMGKGEMTRLREEEELRNYCNVIVARCTHTTVGVHSKL